MCFPWPIKKKYTCVLQRRCVPSLCAMWCIPKKKWWNKQMLKQSMMFADMSVGCSRWHRLNMYAYVCDIYIYIYLELYMYMYRSCHMYLWFVRTKAIGTCTRSADLSAMLNWWILCIWHLRGGWVGHVHFPVQLMVKPRGSPAHRGQTAISGCIILGHSAPACCCIRTLYFCEGFIVALALAVWFLYPHFDEWFFQCGHYWAHSA